MSDFFDVTRMYSYRGIAGNVICWDLVPVTDQYWDDETESYLYDEYSDQFVHFVWHGDDYVHVLDIEDLKLITDDEDTICPCGSVSCAWGG